jgi:hypothetical protein
MIVPAFVVSTHFFNNQPSPMCLFIIFSFALGTNASIGDKWAAEISAEVKKAVASAFDSKYGRRSTMSFTGVSSFLLTILLLNFWDSYSHIDATGKWCTVSSCPIRSLNLLWIIPSL